MTVHEIIHQLRREAGSWGALGEQLGTPAHMPRDWARRGRVPVAQLETVVATSERLEAPVTLGELVAAHAEDAA